MLEEEGGLRRRTPAERETGGDELIQRGIQLNRVPLRDGVNAGSKMHRLAGVKMHQAR